MHKYKVKIAKTAYFVYNYFHVVPRLGEGGGKTEKYSAAQNGAEDRKEI